MSCLWSRRTLHLVEQAGIGSSMDLSYSITSHRCMSQMKTNRVMKQSADTRDCVNLDVNIRGETNATTMLEIIAMIADEQHPVPKNVKTEVDSIHQYENNFGAGQHSARKSGEILDPLKVEKGRLRELGLMSEHVSVSSRRMRMHSVVLTYMRSVCNTSRVMRSDADW